METLPPASRGTERVLQVAEAAGKHIPETEQRDIGNDKGNS